MNAFLYPDEIHIVTDGAGYLQSGEIVHAMQKVAILGHLPAVIATRGSAVLTQLVAFSAALGATSFDQLADNVSAFCRGIHDAYIAQAQAYGREPEFVRSDFIVAGWSEARQRMETYVVTSSAADEFKPWRAQLFTGTDCLFSPDGDGFDYEAIEAELGDFASCPEVAAVRVLEAQRALKVPGHRDPPVGEFVQLTTLTRAGINTRIVKRWPSTIHG